MALAASTSIHLNFGIPFGCAPPTSGVDFERLYRLLGGAMAALGAILAVLGTISADVTTISLGLVAALGGAVLYWAAGRFWGWYWDVLERVQSGEIEPTTGLRAFLGLLFVAAGTAGFAAIWWLASFAGVVTDGALAGNPISIATVAGGVVGVVLGAGFFAVAWVLWSRDASLEITKGSRGFQLLFTSAACPLVGYYVLLFVDPPSAVALAAAYLASFVGSAAVYATRTSES